MAQHLDPSGEAHADRIGLDLTKDRGFGVPTNDLHVGERLAQ